MKTIWPMLPQTDIYRLVLDFGFHCYRVEDYQFRTVCAGELNPGDAECIIREIADRIEEEDRDQFLSSFAEEQLRIACALHQRKIRMVCKKKRQGKVHSIRAQISGVLQDFCVEFCFDLLQ